MRTIHFVESLVWRGNGVDGAVECTAVDRLAVVSVEHGTSRYPQIVAFIVEFLGVIYTCMTWSGIGSGACFSASR